MSYFLEKIKNGINNIREIRLSPPVKDILLGFLVGIIIALLSQLGLFQKFEHMTVDSMFRIRGERSARSDIAIVGIDDTSLEILGRWPWPRSYHASFLEVLNKFHPKFVIFDILFPEPDLSGGDAALANVANECRNLYLAFHFVIPENTDATSEVSGFDDASALPYLKYTIKGKDKFLHATDIELPVRPLMDTAKRVCAINAPTDKDGSTRHLPLVIEFNGRLCPTLSLELACDYLGVDINSVIVKPGVIVLPLKDGDIRIPIDSEGKMVLNFSGSIDTFRLYSYIQLLHEHNKSLEGGTKSILEDLRDKVIFVGHMATGTVDSRITPFSNLFPAVGGHATALANILDRDLIRKAPTVYNIFAVLLVSLLLGLFSRRGKKMFVNLGIMLLLLLAYAVFSFFSFVFLKFWIHTFTPLIAILLAYVTIAINHYEAVRYEKKIMESELLIARKIQESFLPKSYPEVPFLEFAARCNPAKHVGGDLYDFVKLEGEKLGVVIGDVSGKGVPAALYMARTISEFRTASRMHSEAAETLKSINEVFVKEGMEKSFITMQYLIADLRSKRLLYSNGGHNAILHFMKKEKRVEEINTEGGMPIGVMEDVDFDNKEIHLDRGDILFLYTDGISEAMDKRHREFGLDRVKPIIINNSESKAEEIMSKVFDGIARFSKGAPQHDDMTIIVIKAV
jgi:serine phosphatase RsbU (regulator of sigma subunit)/CHASE2 domain-containing sensor protein